MMAVRTIEVRERVMAKNDELAASVRERLQAAEIAAFNLVSSPGSGKTTLLERTLDTLGEELGVAVITGDVQTQNDADRIAKHTTRLVQAVVTGGACHLDARQVSTALDALDLDETRKIVVFSVTEGEDKPLKYPKMFRESRYAILNKIDLLPHVPFDVDLALGYARDVNPDLQFFLTSALTGEGLPAWFAFLRSRILSSNPA
jgi:hydrogenase nickel incorporation protein HypB